MTITTRYHSNLKERDSSTNCQQRNIMGKGSFTPVLSLFPDDSPCFSRRQKVQTLQLNSKLLIFIMDFSLFARRY